MLGKNIWSKILPVNSLSRYQEIGQTEVRAGGNVCGGLVGFDANSLYPWAMTQDMPTGFGIVRRSENGFKLDMSSKHRQSKVASQVNL